MKLPIEVRQLRDAMLAAHPVPLTMPTSGEKEEIFRQWCIRFAEQVAFSFPNQGWGMKRASDGRPISKDTLTQQQANGTLFVWDMFGNVGTDNTTVNGDPSNMVITDQVFVPVTPTNHLGSTPPPPVEPPVEEPPIIDLDDLLTARLAPIEARLSALEAQLAAPATQKYATFKIFGKTVRIPVK